MILILSADPVAAALLGALIETLGCPVAFGRPTETPDQSIRRVRPKVCFVDCADPRVCSEETLGRAAMRGASVVIFGTADAVARVRPRTREPEIDTIVVPSENNALEVAL